MTDIDGQINELSAERQSLWRTGRNRDRVREITVKLEELYEERRLSSAERRGGTRDEITRAARIERELEKSFSR